LESKPSTFSVEIKAIFHLTERTCHRPIAMVSFNGILRFVLLLLCCTNPVAKSKRATVYPTVQTAVFKTPQQVFPQAVRGSIHANRTAKLSNQSVYQFPIFHQMLNPQLLSKDMLMTPLTLPRAHMRSLPLRTSPKQLIISTKHQGTRNLLLQRISDSSIYSAIR
jgi:hypothetical protein